MTNLMHTPYHILALILFCVAYGFVILEEFIQLRKSKPMMLAAGLLWIGVALIAKTQNALPSVNLALSHYLYEYGTLLLFILVAMTYVNVLEEYQVYDSLRQKLVQKKLSYRQLFWITGILTFFISSIADNLTTALALSTVVLTVGKNKPKFLNLGCINVVVAANAGGVFSPFGDITTLMVWQAGILPFEKFFQLFVPALINFGIPALCMHFALPSGHPETDTEKLLLKKGALPIILLFLLTITLTVLMHHFLHLPPVVGMMLGLALLQIFAYYSKNSKRIDSFDIFPNLQRIEWDTLLFFYGVILSVGALATLGYLTDLSTYLYGTLNPSLANTFIGILSALIDNIPVMFSVITMNPSLSEKQWLLVTLTTGVGGSLLSVGSAAGIALMGQARGSYSFITHLKWTWAILLGYFASIIAHLYL